jgi:hypothetical protein
MSSEATEGALARLLFAGSDPQPLLTVEMSEITEGGRHE